jgi:hypothetical protein
MHKYILLVALMLGFGSPAFARDSGRYADDTLKYWFDHLSSNRGMCCSFADGFSVSDVNWDVRDGHYRVWLHGEWIDVPDAAVVTEPNRYGPAVVWPYLDNKGNKTFAASCLEAVHEFGRRAELQALSLIMTKARILRAGHSRQKSLNRVGEIFTEVSNGRGGLDVQVNPQKRSVAAELVFFRDALMIFIRAPDHVLKFPF